MNNFWTFADAHPWPAVALALVIVSATVAVSNALRDLVVAIVAGRAPKGGDS